MYFLLVCLCHIKNRAISMRPLTPLFGHCPNFSCFFIGPIRKLKSNYVDTDRDTERHCPSWFTCAGVNILQNTGKLSPDIMCDSRHFYDELFPKLMPNLHVRNVSAGCSIYGEYWLSALKRLITGGVVDSTPFLVTSQLLKNNMVYANSPWSFPNKFEPLIGQMVCPCMSSLCMRRYAPRISYYRETLPKLSNL